MSKQAARRSLKKEHELMRRHPGNLLGHTKKVLTAGLTAWAAIFAMIFLATVQPSAYGLEFPMATHIALPDAADLMVKPSLTVALYSQLQTGGAISSSNELAPVMPPVIVPIVHAKLLGEEAVKVILGLVPLHVIAELAVITTGTE